MDTTTLQVELRTVKGWKVASLRAEKQVPAIMYGHGFEPKMVTVDGKIMKKTLSGAGESTILDVVVGTEKPVKALIQDVQYDPVTDDIIHIDFRAVRMDEKLRINIPFDFIGESAAVKGMGGTLVKNLEHLAVLCLPGALVKSIAVDISLLKTFEDKLRVHDIALPEGMEAAEKTDEVIVLVAPPRTDEEMAALDQAVTLDATKVEVVKKEKKDEEAEGAEAAAPGKDAKDAKKDAPKKDAGKK